MDTSKQTARSQDKFIEEQKSNVIHFIDESIIVALKDNNIFEAVMSVEDVRNKLINIVEKIEYTDLTESEEIAYWTINGNKIVVDKKYENKFSQEVKNVIIHELLHALTTSKEIYNVNIQAVERCVGIRKAYIYDNKKYKENGRGLNEGITEYLAQKLCPTNTQPSKWLRIEFEISGEYSLEQIMIKQLAILYGENKIIEAYLNNKDIDMPQDEYIEIRESFDYISALRYHVSDVYKGRTFSELSEKERNDIITSEDKLASAFIKSQEFFLEKCLINEINNITTLEQAETVKEKLKELNSLKITVKDDEKANYEKYNFEFVRKYLKIVNQNKSFEEQIKFDEIEKYLLGKSSQDIGEAIAEVDSSLSCKIKGTFNRIKNTFIELIPKSEFMQINIENGEKKYIKECGKEVIAGQKIKTYQYLTEEEFLRYQAGDSSIKGELLKGNIDIKSLRRNKEYRKAIEEILFAPNVVEDRILNYSGYIGSIDKKLNRNINSEVEKRFEEREKYIKLNINGFDESMYITEVETKEPNLPQYILLTKNEVLERKRNNKYTSKYLLRGKINLNKLNKNNIYRGFVEEQFLNKERLEQCNTKLNGYIGEVIDKFPEFSTNMSYIRWFTSEETTEKESIVEENKKKEMIKESGNVRHKRCVGDINIGD